MPTTPATKPKRTPRLSRNHRPQQPGNRTRPADDNDAARLPENPVVCAVCGTAITTRDQAIAKGGSHEHAFFNPAGIAFSIACFRTAPGCLLNGETTTAFSWFPGYSWQIALCPTCRSHLGWLFRTDDDFFYALITAHIR